MRRATCVLAAFGLMMFHTVMAEPATLADVKIETRVEYRAIDGEVKYVFNRDLGRGRIREVSAPSDGYDRAEFARLVIDGRIVSESRVGHERVEAVAGVVHMGRSGFATSRGSFTRARVKRMESTAYTPDAGRGARATFRTATGRRAQYGVVAVDPRVIRLNTLLFVEGYGFAVAADTGGAIKGNIIDVCVPDNQTARNWGRRHVTVHVFKERVTREE